MNLGDVYLVFERYSFDDIGNANIPQFKIKITKPKTKNIEQ